MRNIQNVDLLTGEIMGSMSHMQMQMNRTNLPAINLMMADMHRTFGSAALRNIGFF